MINVSTVPTLGSLIGACGSDDLLSQINSELGGSNFFNTVDDILSKGRQMFVNNFVEPIRQLGKTIKNQITGFSVADKFVSLETEEQFRFVPTCMFEPILAYQPVKELFDQGRIFGFGYECAPQENLYLRLINNGMVEDIAESMDEEGWVDFEYHFKSTDPDLDVEELDCIQDTYNYLDKMLRDTDFDPTDYPNTRG